MEEELRFEDDQRDQPGANPGPYDLLAQRAAGASSALISEQYLFIFFVFVR
jgi:hypothetical protein